MRRKVTQASPIIVSDDACGKTLITDAVNIHLVVVLMAAARAERGRARCRMSSF